MRWLSRSLVEVSSALTSGRITSLALCTASRERATALQSSLNAFLWIETDERVRRDAEESDQRRQRGESRGILDGIPFSVKESYCVSGQPATAGSTILNGYTSPFTATIVQRLLDAGAVLVGRNTMDEFGMGNSTTQSIHGVTRNPYHPEYSAGGSSGGSAAAVASHCVTFALGSDTGGSVRQPASACGVLGLKPTYGRLSRYGLIAYASSLDCPGIFAKSAEDVRHVLCCIEGKDPSDLNTLQSGEHYLPCSTQKTPLWTADEAKELSAKRNFVMNPSDVGYLQLSPLQGVVIGIPQEYFFEELDSSIVNAWKETIQLCVSLGASVQEISLPHTKLSLPAYYVIASAEASSNLSRYDGARFGPRLSSWRPEDVELIDPSGKTPPEYFASGSGSRMNYIDFITENRSIGFGTEVQSRILVGTAALSADTYDKMFAQAQRVRTMVYRDFQAAFETVTAILCPIAPKPGIEISEAMQANTDPVTSYSYDVCTVPSSLAGLPAVSFPVSVDMSTGIPIGMQIIGAFGHDEGLLRLAEVLTQKRNENKNERAT